LGFAAYRNGSFEEARDALLIALELSGTQASNTLFFLALTHERLGDRDAAHRWYDFAAWGLGRGLL